LWQSHNITLFTANSFDRFARVLQAGEREQMRTFVITSADMGEGKTLTALNLVRLLAQTEGIRFTISDDPPKRFAQRNLYLSANGVKCESLGHRPRKGHPH